MGELGDGFREMRDARREYRNRVGITCPECAVARPFAHASILLPGQTCRVDGFTAPPAPKTKRRRRRRKTKPAEPATASIKDPSHV